MSENNKDPLEREREREREREKEENKTREKNHRDRFLFDRRKDGGEKINAAQDITAQPDEAKGCRGGKTFYNTHPHRSCPLAFHIACGCHLSSKLIADRYCFGMANILPGDGLLVCNLSFHHIAFVKHLIKNNVLKEKKTLQ